MTKQEVIQWITCWLAKLPDITKIVRVSLSWEDQDGFSEEQSITYPKIKTFPVLFQTQLGVNRQETETLTSQRNEPADPTST